MYGKILIHCFFFVGHAILLVSSSEAKPFFFVHEENIAHNFLCGQDTLLLTGLKKNYLFSARLVNRDITFERCLHHHRLHVDCVAEGLSPRNRPLMVSGVADLRRR